MKRIIYLGIAVFVVVLAWSGAWLFISGEIRKNVELLATADGVTNPKITCETLSIGGFPFRFDLDCTNATLVSADTSATLTELRASVLVYRPTHLLAFAKGPATLTDAFTGSSSRLDWKDLQASARLDGWRIGRISVTGDNLALNDTVVGDNLVASAKAMEVHLLDIPEQHEPAKGLAALAVYAKASELVAPGFQIGAGETVIEAEINGLPDDVRAFGDANPVQRWQQSGGKIKLVSVRGNDGERFYDAKGTLGLDGTARLEGQVNLTSRGLVEYFKDQIPEPMRPMALGAQGADGSYAQTFNIRAGVVLSSIVPLFMVPPLY
jgi:hypothetical protein